MKFLPFIHNKRYSFPQKNGREEELGIAAAAAEEDKDEFEMAEWEKKNQRSGPTQTRSIAPNTQKHSPIQTQAQEQR